MTAVEALGVISQVRQQAPQLELWRWHAPDSQDWELVYKERPSEQVRLFRRPEDFENYLTAAVTA